MTKISFVEQDQYFSMDNKAITSIPSNGTQTGTPNTDILCNNDEQIIGISERIGTLYSDTYLQNNYGNVMPRSTQSIGNFRYIPRCNSMNWWTLECGENDWIPEYTTQDALQLRCVKVNYNWQKRKEHPNPKGFTYIKI